MIREFALKKPVFRIVANTQTSMGATGYTTGLAPSMSLGCGAYAGNITSDNITPLHLINIKRLAYEQPRDGRGAPVRPARRPRRHRHRADRPSTSSARTTCGGPCAEGRTLRVKREAIVTPAARDLAAGAGRAGVRG